MTLTRRAFLGSAATAALSSSPAVAADDTIVVATPFGMTREYCDLFYGVSGGFYKEAGLSASVIATQGTQSIQQLVAGRVQFARNVALNVILGIEKQDLPLVVIATLSNGSYYNFVTTEETQIRSLNDLPGRTIGITSAVGDGSSNYLALMLTRAGIDPSKVTQQPVGNTPAGLEFVKQKRIDGFMCSVDVVELLQRANAKMVVWSTDQFFRAPCQVYITTREMVSKRPDTVLRFMKAIRHSVEAIIDQPFEPIIDKMVKDFEITDVADRPKAVALQQNQVRKLWLAEGRGKLLRNDAEIWRSGVDLIAQANAFSNKDAAKYYVNDFVDQVMNG